MRGPSCKYFASVEASDAYDGSRQNFFEGDGFGGDGNAYIVQGTIDRATKLGHVPSDVLDCAVELNDS